MRWVIASAVALVFVGCGGSSYDYAESPSASYAGGAGGVSTAAASVDAEYRSEYAEAAADDADSGSFGGGGGWDDWEAPNEPPPPSQAADGDMRHALLEARRVRQVQRIAQAETTRQEAPDGGNTTGATGRQGGQQTATDAVEGGGPLLIYTADITLAVYEVTETQDAILGAVSEMNGFLAQRTDHSLVVRVPADKFHDAMTEIEGKGDVLHRNINVQDVSEEFRDIAIRIRNSEVMRDRLEGLLARADDVEAALAIERELQRLTDLIERLKGRQRFLADRIAFSTITISFSSRATESAPDEFRLPFDWLNELGISNLLTLR